MKKKTAITGKNVWPYLFCVPFLACILLFTVYPTCYSFVVSLTKWNGFSDQIFVGLGNYIRVFTGDKLFWKALGNTLILMGVSTPVTVFLGLVLAYALYNLLHGKRLFQTVAFYPYVITPVAIGFIFSYLFDWQTGFVNKLLQAVGAVDSPIYWLQNQVAVRVIVILMILWRYLGYYAMLFLASMTSISPEIYDAAKVDGASSWKTFWHITVPMLRNTITFLAITSVIGGLKMFEEPMLLFSGWSSSTAGTTGGPGNAVLTVMWKFYNDAYRMDSALGYGAAETYVLFLIIMIVTLILNHITRRKEQ